MTAALAGRNIVVTRPTGQAAHLAEALFELGARPVLFPVLAISSLENTQTLQDAAMRLDSFDCLAFVSPNAVEHSLPTLLAHRSWPAHLRAMAVGMSSEQALARFGVLKVLAPRLRFDSEALLDLPELQDMTGQRVLILRGDGGRPLLGDTLTARGATVEYLTCYRRGRPDLDPAPLLKLWHDGRLDAITVTSSEGLRNLHDMVGKLGQAWLKKTALFVPHQRIAEQAVSLGCQRVIATGPGDDGLIAGLQEHYRDHAELA